MQFCNTGYCNRGNVSGSVICAILVNRLERDQMTNSHDEVSIFIDTLIDVLIKVYFINSTFIYCHVIDRLDLTPAFNGQFCASWWPVGCTFKWA